MSDRSDQTSLGLEKIKRIKAMTWVLILTSYPDRIKDDLGEFYQQYDHTRMQGVFINGVAFRIMTIKNSLEEAQRLRGLRPNEVLLRHLDETKIHAGDLETIVRAWMPGVLVTKSLPFLDKPKYECDECGCIEWSEELLEETPTIPYPVELSFLTKDMIDKFPKRKYRICQYCGEKKYEG